MRFPVLQGGPLLIAHRGGAGLAPENTMAAFRNSYELWRPDMFELDVHATADGHCVVIHDPTVNRTTNGEGRIDSFTLAKLQALDAGYRFTPDGGITYPFRGKGVRIPLFEEVLTTFPEMRITVELKTAAAQKPLYDLIDQYSATERIVMAGEHRKYRTEISRFKGCISACREDAMPYFVLHRLRLGFLGRIPANVVQMPEYIGSTRALSPRLVRELHGMGVQIHVWTVNDPADMKRMLDWGVDGLVTDYPDRLAMVLHERNGRPLPPGFQTARKGPG